MKISPDLRRLIDLGLAKEKQTTSNDRRRIVPTTRAKRELRMLLRRRDNPSYWDGVLLTYALLSEEELERLTLEPLPPAADAVDRTLRRIRR
jgi:hypothetical protein